MAGGLPRRVGPYEPIELLAEGGMARVVVARRVGLGGFERLVALKLILPELAADERYTTMFLDEARLASRISHPNVVSVLDVNRDEATGILYMAMDLVLGSTLSGVRRAHPKGLPIHAALEVIAQAADGLSAAHAATASDGSPLAIVHRDVCPQNLLLGFDGFVRVSDFGIARAEQRSTHTETGKFKGKLGYASPEHVRALPIDHRSDLFALGIVAWELLTGVKLFQARTPAMTLQRVLYAEVPTLNTMRPDMPPDAAAILDLCLQREPEDRPNEGELVASAIREASVAAGLPGAAEALRVAIRHAASDQALRLAGLGPRRTTSVEPPAAAPDPPTRVERPNPDTIVDLTPPLPDPDGTAPKD